jgi:hypothetical protein
MHAAPPVRMSLAPDRVWRGAAALCSAVAGANLAAWVALHVHSAVPVVAAASLAAAAAASLSALWGAQRDATSGVLAWDGGAWQWLADTMAPVAVEPRFTMDLGPCLLLRTVPADASQPVNWRVASRRLAGAAWPQWRTALYASRPADAQAPAHDPQ